MSTTSDMEFLETCRRHFDIFKNEERWNHSNPRLTIARLEAKLNSGFPVANKISERFAAYQIVVNDRQDVYARIDPWAKSARRYLRSCGATKNEIRDGNAIINALLGQKTNVRPPQDTNVSAGNASQSNAGAQLSYAAKYANLQAARAFFGNVSAFQPNEAPLILTNVDVFIGECLGTNEAVSEHFVPLNEAWNERDEILYTNEDSILADYTSRQRVLQIALSAERPAIPHDHGKKYDLEG